VTKAVPLAAKLARDARRSAWVLGAAVLLYMLANGFLNTAFVVAGLWLFYHAQANVPRRGRRAALTVAAFAVLAFPRVGAMLFPLFTKLLLIGTLGTPGASEGLKRLFATFGEVGMALFGIVVSAFILFVLFLPVIGSAAYAAVRRTRREQTLLKAALAGQAGSDEFLALMRDMVDTRIEDVGFHLRYAELLYARGDHRQAAVEARLITVQDPYHFNANLLLANAYYALRLYGECLTVCDEYLAVTGYCFEFQELRQQCAARLGRP
jgi:hypothetical protein